MKPSVSIRWAPTTIHWQKENVFEAGHTVQLDESKSSIIQAATIRMLHGKKIQGKIHTCFHFRETHHFEARLLGHIRGMGCHAIDQNDDLKMRTQTRLLHGAQSFQFCTGRDDSFRRCLFQNKLNRFGPQRIIERNCSSPSQPDDRRNVLNS